MRVYCLYDRVAGRRVGALVADYSDAPVIRMFHDALRDPQSLGSHPGDYEMRHIGEVSDQGELSGADGFTVIATGAQFVEAQSVQLVKEA